MGCDVKYLSLYDLTGIQRYVFGASVLQENLGGSFLVSQALEQWLREATEGTGAKRRWSGGGNAMVTATDWSRPSKWLPCSVGQLLTSVPLVCTWLVPTRNGMKRLPASKKRAGSWNRSSIMIRPGAGHPRLSTGPGSLRRAAPPESQQWSGRTNSSEQQAPGADVDHAREARDDIQAIFQLEHYTDANGRQQRLIWTRDIDRLGRSRGEQSMIGVIHFDGNRIGERFRKTSSLEALRDLSDAVKQAGKQTLRAALGWVLENLPGITDLNRGGFPLHPADERKPDPPHCFPVRPIVYGGDDITLVCEGRIALDLAAELLRAWRHHTGYLPGGAAHACAGVALVRAHYPFYRAYLLAERLCKGAKQYLADHLVDASALDWEFVTSAGLMTLRKRRDELYKAATGEALLHARPYYVEGDPPPTAPHRSWKWFRDVFGRCLTETGNDPHSVQGTGRRPQPRSRAHGDPPAAPA